MGVATPIRDTPRDDLSIRKSYGLCNCPFLVQSSMLRHKYVEHDKKHQCEHCGFCCGSKRELGLHMTKHEEAKFQGHDSMELKMRHGGLSVNILYKRHLCKGQLLKLTTFTWEFIWDTSLKAFSLNFMVSIIKDTACMLLSAYSDFSPQIPNVN